MNRHSLAFKITAIFLGLSIVSVASLTLLAYRSSSGVLQEQASSNTRKALAFRGDMVAEQLTLMAQQAKSLTRLEALQMGATNLRSGWNTLQKSSGDARAELKREFIDTNPFKEREKLLKPEGPSGFYYSTHETFQPEVGRYLAETPFDDLLIAGPDGTVIYSYRKGPAFGENAKAPEWAQSSLGTTFAKTIADAAAVPEGQEPQASFSGLNTGNGRSDASLLFAVPVIRYGAVKSVMLFHVRNDSLLAILNKGHIPDSSLRSTMISADGTIFGGNAEGRLIALGKTDGDWQKAVAASGETMTAFDEERDDGLARNFMRTIRFAGENITMNESLLISEIQAGPQRIAGVLVITGLVVLALIAVATLYFIGRMLSPLTRLARATGDVADGNLDLTISDQDRKDETGVMAKALERFRVALVQQHHMEAAGKETEARAESERRQRLAEREAESQSLQAVVSALDEGLGQLADGNLSYAIHEPFPAETEKLRLNFNRAIARLNETMAAIGGNSWTVRADSERMREGADRLADRTNRQAAAITQTVGAIAAINRTLEEQIAKAEQAGRIAASARKGTEQSGEVMAQTISAIEAIQTSSQQINRITHVIEEIAFQTNLLALNAGVEAARAGEAGKGFAVVAQEVRELAQRSSTAAREITALLQKSTSDVDNGVALVEKAGKALAEIGTHVETINGEIASIMTGTRTEADMVREISQSVGELDQVTQQNSAMVDETTQAIHRLAKEAGEMDRRIGHFTLSDAEPSSPAYRRAG